MLAQAGLKPCPVIKARHMELDAYEAERNCRGCWYKASAAHCRPVAFSACAPKVKYAAPIVETPAAFRENGNWKTAQPSDAMLRGDWWTLFDDPQLDSLEQQIDVSNQNLKAAEAQFLAARALVRGTRSQLFPQVSAGPSIGAAQPSGTRAISNYHDTYTDLLLPVYVSYEVDVWGRIRSAISASQANAQATAADLESARLSLHAELAADYFALRGVDRDKQLLDSAVASYERALELTENRFRGGIASQADVALAETQLETTRAQAVDVEVGRATLEHAIALLIGKPAAEFVIEAAPRRIRPRRTFRSACPPPCSNDVRTSRPRNGVWPRPTLKSVWRRRRSIR